jgi:ElaB protein
MERVLSDRELSQTDEAENVMRDRVAAARGAIDQQVQQLLADIQELLQRVGNAADPEMARLRARIERGVSATKAVIAERASQVQRRASQAFSAGDDYVRGRPWQAVGLAAAAALLVGFLIRRR